jgi:hypothetical protein
LNYLTLNGTIENTLITPEGVNAETGEQYGGRHRVQLMVEKVLKNGQKSKEIVNLNVDDPHPFQKLQGKFVSVPVGAMPDGRQVRFYHARGSVPPLREFPSNPSA